MSEPECGRQRTSLPLARSLTHSLTVLTGLLCLCCLSLGVVPLWAWAPQRARSGAVTASNDFVVEVVTSRSAKPPCSISPLSLCLAHRFPTSTTSGTSGKVGPRQTPGSSHERTARGDVNSGGSRKVWEKAMKVGGSAEMSPGLGGLRADRWDLPPWMGRGRRTNNGGSTSSLGLNLIFEFATQPLPRYGPPTKTNQPTICASDDLQRCVRVTTV